MCLSVCGSWGGGRSRPMMAIEELKLEIREAKYKSKNTL